MIVPPLAGDNTELISKLILLRLQRIPVKKMSSTIRVDNSGVSRLVCIINEAKQQQICGTYSRGALRRVTILAEWLRYFNNLAVVETAAPACFLRENAEGEGMPPLLSH
jgi:hypothetical protein